MVDLELEKKKDELRNKALKKISYRLRTEKEIKDYLNDISKDKVLIEDTLIFLKEYGYIDDINYARAYFKNEKLKLKGINRIRIELKKKGIKDRDIKLGIEKALGEEDIDIMSELESAILIYEKMKNEQIAKGKEIDEKFRAKVFRRLISKGYENDICFKVIKI